MKKQKLTTFQISWMSVCVVLGLISKRIVSPVTNVLTDFLRLPGGSAAAAFALVVLAFLVAAVGG